VNFWRSVSNLTINVRARKAPARTVNSGRRRSLADEARPRERVRHAHDYCTGPSYASGGFIADSQFSRSVVVNGSQQQYLVRNSSLEPLDERRVEPGLAGVPGAPAQTFPNPPYTTLATNPASREKPFLYVDANQHFNVYVPMRSSTVGCDVGRGQTPGRSIPISRRSDALHVGDRHRTTPFSGQRRHAPRRSCRVA